jgi:hypothetical protein
MGGIPLCLVKLFYEELDHLKYGPVSPYAGILTFCQTRFLCLRRKFAIIPIFVFNGLHIGRREPYTGADTSLARERAWTAYYSGDTDRARSAFDPFGT